MTRQVYKLRDTIDIYTLENQYGYTIPKYENTIKGKTKFMLNLYKRYSGIGPSGPRFREHCQAVNLYSRRKPHRFPRVK